MASAFFLHSLPGVSELAGSITLRCGDGPAGSATAEADAPDPAW